MTAAAQSTPVDDAAAVKALIEAYFDALYEGDVASFQAIFHPQCRLFTVVDGKAMTLDHAPYMARVADRPSGASRGDARHDAIETLTVASASTAHARVRDAYLPARFLSELTFLKEEGRWWILAKAWHVLTD